MKRIAEVVPGYPDRMLPVNEKADQKLKKLTLTDLCNKNPSWLAMAHETLNSAVAAAYGWEPTLTDEEALRRLLELSLPRAGRAFK